MIVHFVISLSLSLPEAFFVEVLILLISMKLPLLIRICYKRVREDYKMRV